MAESSEIYNTTLAEIAIFALLIKVHGNNPRSITADH